MKKITKILLVCILFLNGGINSLHAGLLSKDDLFIGFWKQYSTDANGKYILSSDDPHLQGYLEIKKNDNIYTIIFYDPISFSHTSNKTIVTGYYKFIATAKSKGGTLVLNLKYPKKGLALLIYSRNNGKSIEFVTRSGIKKLIKNYEKIDKDKANRQIQKSKILSKSYKIELVSAQMKQIEEALKNFRLDFGRYPSMTEGLKILIKKPNEDKKYNQYPRGGYLDVKKLPKDPWGNDYIYINDEGKIDIISLGADNKEGGEGENRDLRLSDIKD